MPFSTCPAASVCSLAALPIRGEYGYFDSGKSHQRACGTAALLFAAAQVSFYRRRRRRDAMLELVRSFQSPTFSRALRRVVELPDNASAAEIQQIMGTEGKDLLVHLAATWETIGVLLFHGELTLDIIDDFFSGPILISWRRLLPYTTDQRQRYQRDTWWEWFQWLAERMMERE